MSQLPLFDEPGDAPPQAAALAPAEMAQAVLAVVSAPKGTRYAVLEVQPEAPVTQGEP